MNYKILVSEIYYAVQINVFCSKLASTDKLRNIGFLKFMLKFESLYSL